jgi:hypothetical protein
VIVSAVVRSALKILVKGNMSCLAFDRVHAIDAFRVRTMIAVFLLRCGILFYVYRHAV